MSRRGRLDWEDGTGRKVDTADHRIAICEEEEVMMVQGGRVRRERGSGRVNGKRVYEWLRAGTCRRDTSVSNHDAGPRSRKVVSSSIAEHFYSSLRIPKT